MAHDQGDSALALSRCRQAVALLAGGSEASELACIYTSLSRFESAVGDWQAAVRAGERAVAMAERSGDAATFCVAANWLAFHLPYAGQVDRAERLALSSLTRAEEAGQLPALQQACQMLGTIYGDIRAEHRRARGYYRRSLILARRCGDLRGEIKALHNLGAWVSKPLGHWRRAEILLSRARALACRASHHRAALYSLVHLGELACARGQFEEARERLRALRAELTEHGDLMTRCRVAAKVEAWVLAHEGQPAEALDRLRAVWREAEGAGFMGGLVVVAPQLADLLLDLGNTQVAEAVLARVESLWAAVGDRGQELEGLRIRARLAGVRGDRERAQDLLGRACDQALALDRPLDLARAQRDRAVILAEPEPGPARDLFCRSLAAFVTLGAKLEVDLTRRIARRHVGDIRLRQPGATGPSVPGRLTTRQAQIAALVAHGKTNREIGAQLALAEGTVEVHVGHIFDRLGLEHRAQVAAWAAEARLAAAVEGTATVR